jgi:hypothetical protein
MNISLTDDVIVILLLGVPLEACFFGISFFIFNGVLDFYFHN